MWKDRTIRAAAKAAVVVISLLPCVAVCQEASLGPRGCFIRKYPVGSNSAGYSWVRIAIGHKTLAETTSSVSKEPIPGEENVDFDFGYHSLPNVQFGYSAWSCSKHGASLQCSVECDSGGITLHPLLNGDLLVEGSVAVGVAPLSSILLHQDGSLQFEGPHTLRRVDPQQCVRPVRETNDARVIFQPGDYSPKIRELSSQLAKLGFLAAPSDSLYSTDVAGAMRKFQASIGLNPTGMADVQSIRLLALQAETRGGC
jgi:putative peptidoglycan binding protein